MKSIFVLGILILLFSPFKCKVFSEGTANASNTAKVSTSYSIAKVQTDQFYVDNQANFKSPLVVAVLPPRINLNTGKIETIDELPSEVDYYDGSKKLHINVVNCNQWLNQKEACIHQGSCGWCGSSNSCVSGNSMGPTAPCLRGTFSFSAPANDFNPFNDSSLHAIRREFGGAQLTTFVK